MAIAAFSCTGCGSPTTYLPAGLTCDVCGRITAVEPLPGTVRRRPLRPVFEGDPDWTPEIPDELEYQLACPNCGGGAAYVGTLRASWCPFCAAAVALKDVHELGGRLPIDGIIPFQIDEWAAHRAVRRWIARAWLAPHGMRVHGRATNYARVYVPVLSVDARLKVNYVSRGSLHSDTGAVEGSVRDIVVGAGTWVNQEWLDSYRPWPLDLVVPYRPEYLAGAFCESYDHSLPTIRTLTHDALRTRGAEMANAALNNERTWGGEPPSLVSSTCQSSEETYRHLLIPVYFVSTRVRDSVHQVVVNGIDGTIRAIPPMSAWKVALPAGVVGVIGLAWPWWKDLFGF